MQLLKLYYRKYVYLHNYFIVMAGSIDRIYTSGGIISMNNSMMDFIGSEATCIDTSTIHGQILAYRYCNVLQDAIDIKSRYHSSLKMSAQKESGDWIVGNYGTAIEKSTVKKDLLKIKMMNERETFLKFNYRLKKNLHVFGVCYVWKQEIAGFTGRYNYYIIPRNRITPIYSTKKTDIDLFFNQTVDHYDIRLYNGTMRLERDEVFVFNDGIESFKDNDSSQSRLVALKEPISAILSANQMFTELIADGGARGIISQGANTFDMLGAPILEEEKMEMQRELKRYGKMRQQFKYMVTRGVANYVPLTSSITEMQLPENLLAKKVDIYRGFLIPNAFAQNESRFKVLPESRKELFTSSVIPEAEDMYEEILQMIEMPERDWLYKPDSSHMDFFQEPLLQSATALQMASQAIVPLFEKGIYSKEQSITELTPYMR